MKKTQKKAKNRHDVDSAPDDELEAYRITIRDRLDSMIRHQITAGIEISMIVDKMMRNADLGKNAVAQLEDDLALDRDELRRLQSLVGRVSGEELAAMQKLRMKNGRMLTLDHLVVLAAADSISLREELAKQTVAESMTVRELIDKVPPKLLAKSAISVMPLREADEAVAAKLRELADELSAAAQQAEENSSDIHSVVGELEQLLRHGA